MKTKTRIPLLAAFVFLFRVLPKPNTSKKTTNNETNKE